MPPRKRVPVKKLTSSTEIQQKKATIKRSDGLKAKSLLTSDALVVAETKATPVSLPNMPLDLLLEVSFSTHLRIRFVLFNCRSILKIFNFIDGQSLVSLSHTSKAFYLFLSSRSSKSIWKRLLREASHPGCPSYLAEFAYARLIFEDPSICSVSPRSISFVGKSDAVATSSSFA